MKISLNDHRPVNISLSTFLAKFSTKWIVHMQKFKLLFKTRQLDQHIHKQTYF